VKVIVDRERCEGYGQCEAVAPDLFRLDDNGETQLLVGEDVPAGQPDAARRAVRLLHSQCAA
jgi:ferredoxin